MSPTSFCEISCCSLTLSSQAPVLPAKLPGLVPLLQCRALPLFIPFVPFFVYHHLFLSVLLLSSLCVTDTCLTNALKAGAGKTTTKTCIGPEKVMFFFPTFGLYSPCRYLEYSVFSLLAFTAIMCLLQGVSHPQSKAELFSKEIPNLSYFDLPLFSVRCLCHRCVLFVFCFFLNMW